MMDANNIQVSIFYIYSSKKASEREGNVCFTGTKSYTIEFTWRKRIQLKNIYIYKFVEQNSYLCIKTLKTLYKYVQDWFCLPLCRRN